MNNVSFCHISSSSFFFYFYFLLTLSHAIHGIDPIKCTLQNSSNCTITNSYGVFPDRAICRAARALFPTSEADLISAVANATKSKTKIKVATRFSHSIPKLVCPHGNEGILISTKFLDRVLEIDASSMTMTVESGMTLRQLIEEAAKANLALPYTPYWLGLTVGGMIGTGEHGSSLWGLGSRVHDYVIGMRIVTLAGEDEGYAKVRVLGKGNEEMDAAKLSLGVLGVISQVTLQLQPMFKRSITRITKSDINFGDEIVRFGRRHEFADFTWYPSQKIVVYRIDDRVSANTSGNGLNDFIGFRSTPLIALSALRNTGTLFLGYPVIGYQNHIQASGSCLNNFEDARIAACSWDSRVNGLFYHQTSFSIPLSKAKSFIEDVQKLVHLQPNSLCGLDLYNGILVRYVTASSAYLGKQEDALDFDITYYRSKDPLKPRLFQDILEEIEQMGVFKYNGLPHWGKNRNVAFQGAIKKYKNASKFMEIKQMYDPFGIFSSEWTDQILGLKDGLNAKNEGCALEGLCICSKDIHCAPKKGYFCRPGKVYEKARVCTKI